MLMERAAVTPHFISIGSMNGYSERHLDTAHFRIRDRGAGHGDVPKTSGHGADFTGRQV